MKIRPYCGQDYVWNVRLETAPEFAFRMCFECDSVWREGEDVSDQQGANFEQYMTDLSLSADWKRLEKVSPVPA